MRASSVGELAQELQSALGDKSSRMAHDIIAALLDVPRFWPPSHLDEAVSDQLRNDAFVALARLQQSAPFAYAVGRVAFRHLTLEVDERVLIPRPETEMLVDELLRLVFQGGTAVSNGGGVVVDIGTGSGAIALALANEAKFSRIIGTDLSLEALTVARRNAEYLAGKLKSTVEFRHGWLLEPVRDVRVTAIVSNPPYIAFDEVQELPASVRDWEPARALLSNDDGMAATAEIVRDAAELLEPGGVLAMETDSRRAPLVAELLLLDQRYEHVAVRLDLTGRQRFVVARRRAQN